MSARIVPRPESEADHVLTFDDRYAITPGTRPCTYPKTADSTVAECAVPIPMGSDDSDIYDVGQQRQRHAVRGAGKDTLSGGPGRNRLHQN
ncbi:hypothetical protein [Streptomyces ossamyceticus]|uniref:hypothetical protein n=1 Tax=Streptomyces ossamyceticus TaxID=249581 RepID=UPI001969F02F|nr:hypothetical protein [Streptomyces ossamyceticus]